MKFALVTLHVADMEKALGFYNGVLGMPIVRRQAAGPMELAFLGFAGQVQLELVAGGEDAAYSGFSIGFEVADMAAAKARLVEAGYAPGEDMEVGGGTALCFVKRPFGEDVELICYGE